MVLKYTMASAIILAATLNAPAFAAEQQLRRTLSLTGHGETRVTPDMALVNIGVANQAQSAADALSANTRAIEGVLYALKAAGIAEGELQTADFTIQPRYEYGNDGKPPHLIGYDVSNSLIVSVRQLDRLGAILDRVVRAGSNQINGVHFDVVNSEAAKDQARRYAVEDAHRKAELYASTNNIKLGHIVSIAEAGGLQPPVPTDRVSTYRAEGVAADVPIAKGKQTISTEINIVWEIE